MPEPAPTRKTLSERAGETKRDDPGAVSNTSRHVKTGGRPGLRNPQPSRNIAKSSNTSVGPGGRPQPTQSNARLQTSLSKVQRSGKVPRPQTSIGTHEENASGPVLGKRKGTPQFSQSFSHCPQPPTSETVLQRGTYDNHMNYNMNWSSYQAGQRNTYLCMALRGLSLKDPPPTEVPQLQEPQKTKLPQPVTPIKHTSFMTPSPSPSKSTRASPQKHPRKLPAYLTRDSHTKAWDTEDRFDGAEHLFKMFSEKIDNYNKESLNLAETVAMHKSRSKFICGWDPISK